MAGYAQDDDDLRGVRDPDFLALGLGGTSMMAMLWAIAMGRRAVGVEMRGDPFLGVHWNIRADLYHQFGLIDRLMLERYGEDRLPRRGESGKLFLLAETFYSAATKSGDIVADEIIDGFDAEQHIAGTIHHVEFIDDRWRDGLPHRTISLLTPPSPPGQPDETLIRTEMTAILDGPSTFQAGAASILVMLRRYLEKMEQLDLDGDYEPRVRLFTRHRVVNTPEGFIKHDDGRVGFRIEALQELDYRGKFVRVRRPGSAIIEVGVPELFMIAQGFHSTDAERLGFRQEDVAVDHRDGRGPVVAQADFLAGLVEALVGGRLRRRISSEFDDQGNEYWARQIAVGHEDDPEVGWCLVQVPDFKVFDPIREGLIPEGSDTQSPEFFAAYESLVYDFYAQHVGDILEMPKEEIKKIQMVYGPKLFTLIERMGEDALLAPNGVVAGDSFGNGHFLTSGGAMTGMSGHSWRVYEYYRARDAGSAHAEAIRTLADRIKEDTLGWLHVSAKEYSEAVPINFGAERIAQIEVLGGLPAGARAAAIDATRRQRHSLLPLDPSDWRRVFLRNGRVHSAPLPELHAMHPALRGQQRRKRGDRNTAVFVAPDLESATLRFLSGILGQPGARIGLITREAPDAVPPTVRERLAAHAQVAALDDAARIVDAVGSMSGALGRPARLLGTAPCIQMPLALAREQLGIDGMRASGAQSFADLGRQRQRLGEAGFPIPRYATIESVEDGLAFATDHGYFPILVRPNIISGDERSYRVESDAELLALLERLAPSAEYPLICDEFLEGEVCTLDVFSVGGVPAWAAATRRAAARDRDSSPGIILPREQDDPADPLIRRIGYAALKALGTDTGLASLRWLRCPDGGMVILDAIAAPPTEPAFSLLALAHDINLYRAWANAVINGLFAPVPRSFAAGASYFPVEGAGKIVSGIRGLSEIVAELGDRVVHVQAPRVGQEWSDALAADCFILVRHAETAAVDAALRRIADAVVIELGDGTTMATA